MEKIEIKTRDGMCDCNVYRPENNKDHLPAIIFYGDAIGNRPAMNGMGQRFADTGYYVLMPNVYYRAGHFKPFNGMTAFTDPDERARLTKLMKSVDTEKNISDAKAFLDYLDSAEDVKKGKRGLAGYCMGGRISMAAAGTFPDRIGAFASIHGSRFFNDNPDSPHLFAKNITAKVYIGGADGDAGFTPEDSAKLEQIFKDARIDYEIELYHGAKHGFAMPDFPAYDKNASEHQFVKVIELFDEVLK